MKRVLLFDFDGVIVDSLDVALKAYDHIAPDYGLKKKKTKKEFVKLYYNNLYESLIEEGLSKNKIKEFNVELRDHFIIFGYHAKYFKGMKEVFEALNKNNKIIVISSNISSTIRNLIKKSRLKFIPEILGGDRETSKVKKIEGVKKEYPKAEIFYIGDTVGDAVESQKAGVKSVAVTWGYHSAKELLKVKPDFIVSRPEELLKLFD